MSLTAKEARAKARKERKEEQKKKLVRWSKYNMYNTFELRGYINGYTHIFSITKPNSKSRKFKYMLVRIGEGIFAPIQTFPTQKAAKEKAEILALKYIFGVE